MKKVTALYKRKLDHIQINLEEDVKSSQDSGLGQFAFIHEALPEIDLEDVNMASSFLNKSLSAPVLISSMTGGTKYAMEINTRLAEAAQECGIAMGVGSQRIAILDPRQIKTFTTVRQIAPDILLFANLGAIQLNNGYTIEHCRKAVDMLEADALILHLNPLQEALQADGNTNFSGLARKIGMICKLLPVPVIVKEVGWGISERTARILSDCGVYAIDVAGAGGTSWSQVEMYRARNILTRQLAATFRGWGITTAESIITVKRSVPDMTIIASGGIVSGLDVAKCIALGASLCGLATRLLSPATVSSRMVVDTLKLVVEQLRITMFAMGVRSINEIQRNRIKNNGSPVTP